MKSFLLSALKLVATIASGLGKNKKLFILIYHRVLEQPDFMRPGEADKQSFTWQMDLLANYFNVITLADAVQHLKNDTLPARAVCITFDDGYADNYLHALPILQKYGLTATFFVASGYLNGGRMWNDSILEAVKQSASTQLDLSGIELGIFPITTQTEKLQSAETIIKKIKHLEPALRLKHTEFVVQQAGADLPNELMMTSEQLQKLHASGMEIGGHTVSHPILAKVSDKQFHQEITDNKQDLEAILNNKLRYFAYPNGKLGQDYLPEQVGRIKQHGYEASVSTQWGVASSASDLWQLPRFTPWDTHPVKFMMRMISMYQKSF